MGKRAIRGTASAVLLLLSFTVGVTCVHGETLQEIRNEKQEAQSKKNEAENNLSSVNEDIESISGEKEAVEAEIEELDAQLVDLLVAVSVLETDIEEKEQAIEATKAELEEAKEQVTSQEAAMARRIKFMYEQGSSTYLELFLESKSMAEAVNKSEYSERLYKYDRLMLERYRLARQEVEDKEKQLEDELAEQEEIKKDLTEQKDELDTMIAEKKKTADDFDSRLSKARAKADEYKNQIALQADNLKKLNQAEAVKLAEEAKRKAEEEARKRAEAAAKKKAEEEAKKKAEEEAAAADKKSGDEGTKEEAGKNESKSDEEDLQKIEINDDGDTGNDSGTSEPEPEKKPTGTSVRATGSGKGTDIANYALQFVGGPYVPGGTSLTNGCDCSGFTQSVYSNFGIGIPRSSYSQSTGGTEVSFDGIQAGDIVYYGGHVGIYIGNNQIVHASTPATGIKISSVFYRSIITIRRYY